MRFKGRVPTCQCCVYNDQMDWGKVRSDAVEKKAPLPTQTHRLGRVERRREFRVQTISAAIYKHPHGLELRVFLGEERNDDLLFSELAGINLPLEEKATSLREVLLETGWSAIDN